MGKALAPWRHDDEFMALAKQVWPSDVREADPNNRGYSQSTRNKAAAKLRHRWEGHVATRGQTP